MLTVINILLGHFRLIYTAISIFLLPVLYTLLYIYFVLVCCFGGGGERNRLRGGGGLLMIMGLYKRYGRWGLIDLHLHVHVHACMHTGSVGVYSHLPCYILLYPENEI